MNLKPKKKEPWLDKKYIKFIAVYIALALVLVINQVVFSYLLKNREMAKAMSNTLLGNLFIPLGSSNVEAGSNNGLAGEFLMPDAWVTDKPSQTCSFRLDDLGNTCMTLVDADGTVTAGTGVVADGAKIAIWDWVAPGGNVAGEIFNAGDKLCTDNLVTPTCVYVDSDSDCLGGTGTQTYILGSGCAALAPAPADTPVIGTTTPQWYHTELVNANGQYDYSAILGNSEAIWIDRLKADDVLYQGSNWNQAFPNQWQGDALGTWSAQDTLLDANANGRFDPGETIIKDKDLNGVFTTQPTSLVESDGTASLHVEDFTPSDDVIPEGATLTPLANSDNVCLNTMALYGEGSIITPQPVILYVDGGSGDPGPLGPPDCIPGNGGTDVVLRNEVGAGDDITTNVGVFPHTFFTGAGTLLYYDGNLNGHWDYGNSLATTETLWINDDSLGIYSIPPNWSPYIEGVNGLIAGPDDSAFLDYSWVNGLWSADNVCFSTNPALVGTLPARIEDVYVDGGSGAPGPLGSPDCIPGNGGVDVVLKDVSIDGLSSASYANGTGVFEYKDHNVVPGVPGTGNGHWDATEGLWYGVRGNNFALADDPIISGPAPIYGYTPLTRFDASTGPTGQPLIYADADSSGTVTASDTILEDNGNVQTGLPGVPNSVIDREADIMNHLSFQNSGTANNTYISLDLYDAGANGVCDNPVGSVDDNFLANIPWTGSEWALAGNGVAFTSGVRNCVAINVSPFAGLTDLGKTFILTMPQLADLTANGLYDAGDEGWFFYSGNDGPTGASVTVPYTLTIIADTVSPTVISATTGDADHDGKIDILTVVYNEPVNDANYDAVAVTGYALLGTGSGTGTTTLVYNLTEGGVFDTDATPALTWTGANAQDLGGNLLNTAGAPANATDGSEPVIVSTAPVSGSTDAKLDAHIIIIFSEPINPGGLSGSAPVPPPLGIAWSAGNTVLTVTHGNFTNGTAYTMAVTTAPDLAGNPLVAGPVANPWTFTTLIPSYGSNAQDLTPPGPLTNVKIKADSSGTITLSWQDPTDTDLNNIVIDELSAGQTNTQNVNKGVQTLTLSKRKVGQEYKYTLRAQDTSGNLSPKQIYSITVPSAGETVITRPAIGEVLPSPLLPQVILPTGIKIGDLLKNPTAKTVYVVGNEGKRHVFPNEPTFFTWFKDFSLIKTVSNDILSQIPLNSNVTVRPGAKLVKIQTDPNIYAVEPGGIIRAIKSEVIARDLYGTAWAKRVLDVPDVFFVNYVKGPDITAANYPTGSLIKYQGSSEIYYLDNLLKKLVTPEVFASNLFRDEFVIKNVATTKVYPLGDNLPKSSIVDMMMLK